MSKYLNKSFYQKKKKKTKQEKFINESEYSEKKEQIFKEYFFIMLHHFY